MWFLQNFSIWIMTKNNLLQAATLQNNLFTGLWNSWNWNGQAGVCLFILKEMKLLFYRIWRLIILISCCSLESIMQISFSGGLEAKLRIYFPQFSTWLSNEDKFTIRNMTYSSAEEKGSILKCIKLGLKTEHYRWRFSEIQFNATLVSEKLHHEFRRLVHELLATRSYTRQLRWLTKKL